MNAVLDPLEVEFANFSPRGGCGTTHRPGVLIVIRDWSDRTEIADQLRHQGFHVWTVGSGLDALSACRNHARPVDLVLLDADLPDLPARAFHERFSIDFPDIPCVLLIDGPEASAMDLIVAGATVFLREISPAVLADRLWETLAFGGGLDD